ncbi:hypothetical protein C8Q78DRAFT_104198 [Trametes maxima]|nr:hypothetical protein C8Q78DRAFT_104198 [Trametes maxima]
MTPASRGKPAACSLCVRCGSCGHGHAVAPLGGLHLVIARVDVWASVREGGKAGHSATYPSGLRPHPAKVCPVAKCSGARSVFFRLGCKRSIPHVAIDEARGRHGTRRRKRPHPGGVASRECGGLRWRTARAAARWVAKCVAPTSGVGRICLAVSASSTAVRWQPSRVECSRNVGEAAVRWTAQIAAMAGLALHLVFYEGI